MLELARALVLGGGHALNRPVILLFNGAEETNHNAIA